MRTGTITNVKKIAVLRANSLGDLIFVLPAVRALKQTYPKAEIIYLGSSLHKEFLKNRPEIVDRVLKIPLTEGILVDPKKQVNSAQQTAFFKKMQAENFDIAFQLHGGGRYTNPFMLNLGARVTIGSKTPDAPPLNRYIPYIFYQHEVIRNLEIVSLAGAGTKNMDPFLPVQEKDISAAQHVLTNINKPFIVIHPGSSDQRRMWPSHFYAQVGDFLQELGFSIVLTGSAAEKNLIKQALSQMKYQPFNSCGLLNLSGLIGLLSQAEMIVTNNTGPLHLAQAIGTKAVAVFWAEQAINTLPLNRRNFYPLIAWNRICPLCQTYCDKSELDRDKTNSPCRHNVSFIDEITPPQVIKAIRMVLGL